MKIGDVRVVASAAMFLLVWGMGALSSAHAGCYSDWCANRSSGSTSSNLTLKYGGTYGQAAQNYNNYRWGYGTGGNTDYYSPYHYPGAPTSQGITPQQQAEIDRLNAQSEALINQIMNDPIIWGR